MSAALYPTRLYFAGGKGLAKLNNEELRLASCPQLFEGVVIDAIDFAPGVVGMFMPRWEGWKEMDGEQREACMSHLRSMFGIPKSGTSVPKAGK